MLFLILAHGHVGRLVDQDVSRLQHGIGEQADAGALGVLAGLVLELGHTLQPAQARHALENPGELGMGRDCRLGEHGAAVRVHPGGDIGGCGAAHAARQFDRVMGHGDSVHVHHAVEAVGLAFLQAHPVFERAQIIADMQPACGLHARQDAFRAGIDGQGVAHG